MKYTGTYLMDDTGIKEQKIIAGKIRVKLEKLLGQGQFRTDVGIDNVRLLKWTFITDSDETPATKTVVIDPNSVDDPATEEILDHEKADAKEAKKLAKTDEVDEDKLGAHLGSHQEQDDLHRAKN